MPQLEPNCKVIRPMTITSAHLTSTNAVDATAEYLHATSYSIGNLVKVTVTAAPTPVTATHKIYSSVQNTNQGHDPTTDTTNTWWAEVSSTNPYKMFDDVPQDQTTRADNIAVVITPGQTINALGLINIDATEAVISITSILGGGTVYSETHSLIDVSQIGDWYDYFFEPVRNIGDYAITGLPTYDDVIVSITLNHPGGTALCGACVLGQFAELGYLEHGSAFGLIDYSTTSIDAQGRFTITNGNYSKRVTATIICETRLWSGVQAVFYDLRNTPVVWIGDESVVGSIVYGYYREFGIAVNDPALTTISLTVQGLTAT